MPAVTAALGPYAVNRMGFGAMQLPGKGVMGPPRTTTRRSPSCDGRASSASITSTRRATTAPTSPTSCWPRRWSRGPRICGSSPRSAPAAASTARGCTRWRPTTSARRSRPTSGRFGIDRLTAVDLRVLDTPEDAFDAALDTLIALRDEGKLELIGLSNIDVRQLEHALARTDIACVQNQYGVLDRGGEDVLAATREIGIAFVPVLPARLGFRRLAQPRWSPGQRSPPTGATPSQVALAGCCPAPRWSCPFPGTSSLAHLEENVGAADVALTPEQVAALDGLAAG